MVSFRWGNQNLSLPQSKDYIKSEMKDFISEYKIPLEKLTITNHHTSHCAGAYYTSGFEEPCFVFSYDAGGLTHGPGDENTYGKTFIGYDGKMKLVNKFPMAQSSTIPCG